MKKTNPSSRSALQWGLVLATAPWTLSSSAQAQCCWGCKPAAPYAVGSPYPISYPAQSGGYAAARPVVPVTPITPSNGAMTSYYGNYGMLPPTTGNALPNGFPQAVVSAMPTAAYDTQWQRTPVTYYRPVTQYDPNYGTTVTSLQPCTSYQYQAQRVPLVAPTPLGGAYAQASNQWPAINQPGYFPTGATNAYAMSPVPTAAPTNLNTLPAAPVYPQVQYLPANGTIPATGAVQASGTSSPSANFNANTNSGLSSAVYYGNPTSVTSANPNCPGGNCPTNLTPPNVPGATSIVPMGPVSYLPAQGSVPQAGLGQPSVGQSGAVLPNSNNLVLPPSSPSFDPAASRAPSLPPPPSVQMTPGVPSTPGVSTVPGASTAPGTSSASLWSDRDERVSKMVPMTRLPMVPIDRPVSNSAPSYPTSRSVSSDPAAIASPFPGSAASSTLAPPTLLPNPPSLNQPSLNQPYAKPLVAPDGFDGKPHWNPKLLPPSATSAEDKVALRSPTALK